MLNKNDIFESNNFALQVMAVGSFLDAGCGNGKLYQVEATTARLNHVAYNEWLSCQVVPNQDDFVSEAEWEAAKLDRLNRFEAWTKNVLTALHMDLHGDGSVNISRSHAEVFTVVRTRKIAAKAGAQWTFG